MGMKLFVLQSQVPDAKLGKLYACSAVFLVANAILIALLLAFPEIELWLPDHLY
jgi:TRAP-type C4-dicarboxylate transport system permease large subunit